MNEISFYKRNTEDIIKILKEIIECDRDYDKRHDIRSEKYKHYMNLYYEKRGLLNDVEKSFEAEYDKIVNKLVYEKYPDIEEVPVTGFFKSRKRQHNLDVKNRERDRSDFRWRFYNPEQSIIKCCTYYGTFRLLDFAKELFGYVPEEMIELKKKADVLKEEVEKMKMLMSKYTFENYVIEKNYKYELYEKYGVPYSIQGNEKYMCELFISGRAKNIQEALDKLEVYVFRKGVENELDNIKYSIEENHQDNLRQQSDMYDDIVNKQSKVISEINSNLNTNMRKQQDKLNQIQSDVDYINYKIR